MSMNLWMQFLKQQREKMNSPDLSAVAYGYNQENYAVEFEKILTKITLCYNLMVDSMVMVRNDENAIRDTLLFRYLKNDVVRNKFGLTDFLFDREVPEDISDGRTDIKISTLNTFISTEAYYIIECKRIDSTNTNGKSGLNSEYIKNGICRFVNNLYSCYYNINGIIGFVVDGLNINENISNINTLFEHFPEANTVKVITQNTFIPNFPYHYSSTHLDNKKKPIALYHLMFDLSKNIGLN